MNSGALLTSLLVWSFFGLLAGWIASLVLPKNRGKYDVIEFVGVGVLGAVLAGAAAFSLSPSSTQGVDVISPFVSIIGSGILIVLIHKIGQNSR